jgi:protein ImuA
MDLTKLTRQSHRQDRPGLPLLGRFRLAGARAHELCGTARRRLALWVATEAEGPVMWIRPGWHPDRLHMAGVRAEIDPARLIFVEPERPADLLWSMEEALRAGVLPLVVCDLPEPPGLTPVRRLHLAAEAGVQARGGQGLGLILTPGDGGAAGVESRWRLEPAHGAEETRWRLGRLRARDAPPADWPVTRGPEGRPALAEGRTREPA